jgi:hypothetical protein
LSSGLSFFVSAETGSVSAKCRYVRRSGLWLLDLRLLVTGVHRIAMVSVKSKIRSDYGRIFEIKTLPKIYDPGCSSKQFVNYYIGRQNARFDDEHLLFDV